MRRKNPALMDSIHDFAEEYFFEYGKSPSVSEIAKSEGISKATAYRYLVAMAEKGMIDYDGSDIITRKMRLTSQSSAPSGVFRGAIPCGPLDEVEAGVEEYVQLPVSLFGTGELFVLRTRGDSMIDAGIEEGDLVVVKRQQTADVGEIVVALSNGSNTLKRLEYRQDKSKYVLHPENSSMEDIEVKELEIQGVAKFVIKAL